MGIYTVELYLKVRLACSEGMSRRQAGKHYNISRDSVAKMMSYSKPPSYCAGRITHSDWTRAEGKRAVNKLRDTWKKPPWAPYRTVSQ